MFIVLLFVTNELISLTENTIMISNSIMSFLIVSNNHTGDGLCRMTVLHGNHFPDSLPPLQQKSSHDTAVNTIIIPMCRQL